MGGSITVSVCQISEDLLPTHLTSSSHLQLSELVLLGQKAIQRDGEAHAEQTEGQDKVTASHDLTRSRHPTSPLLVHLNNHLV